MNSPSHALPILLACLVALLVASPMAGAQDPKGDVGDGWRELFDGESLSGWHQVGGKAKYHVEDGEIVGTTVLAQPNSFLRTDREYADFELELDLRVGDMNSGVQVRSHTRKNGRVYGTQVEIDPSPRAWSGGIYDEGRRGWLNDLKELPEARSAFRRDDWNHYRIVCVADSLRTWVNGVPAADLVDSLDPAGFIALQVHGIGNSEKKLGQQVRWRNIRIRDLGAHAWRPIWNGADTTGWRPLGGGKWQVEDGVLVGTSAASEKRHGILLSGATHGDFTARLSFRAVRGNSGFYFRCAPVKGGVSVHGFQAEMDPDPAKHTGGLYETGGRGWVVRPDAAKLGYRPEKWSELTVSARGGRVVVHLNGKRSAELRDDPGRPEGHLGIQLHGGQDMRVEVRSIELLERQ